MSFDRATFYAALRRGTLFDHGLSQRQVQGTEAILDAWDKSGFTDERWLAYILGTTYHETGRAMFPVREGGLGKGHPYGVAAANGQFYYGRGFVQLTWQANYAKADKALDLGGKLVADADLALDPPTSAQILLRGMTEAWFTSFKLSDYLNDHLADYLHARRIVNGMDQAETIAGYALVFFAAITAGAHKAADTTSIAAVPAPAAPPPPVASSDPISDIAGAVLGPVIADTIGQAIAPAGPSPGTSAPSTATDEGSLMNPMLAISIVEQAVTYGPQLAHILAEVPDIVAKGKDLIARLQAMDFATAEVDAKAIAADLGLTQDVLASIVSHATKTTPPAAKAA